MTPDQLLPTLETPAAVLAAILAVYLRSSLDHPADYVIELCTGALRAQGLTDGEVNAMIERTTRAFLPEDDPLDWDFLAG